MADRHQRGSKDHGTALTQHAIGKQASKERGQVNKSGIEAINLRCEGLHAERAEYAFEHAAYGAEPDDVVIAGQQQVLHHVKDEQGAHSVIRKALPHLGGEQECQPARMAEKIAHGGVDAIGACVSRRTEAVRRGFGPEAVHQSTSESWRLPVASACVKDDSEIPSRRTPFSVGRSGSSKTRLRHSRPARLSMASPMDLLRVIC